MASFFKRFSILLKKLVVGRYQPKRPPTEIWRLRFPVYENDCLVLYSLHCIDCHNQTIKRYWPLKKHLNYSSLRAWTSNIPRLLSNRLSFSCENSFTNAVFGILLNKVSCWWLYRKIELLTCRELCLAWGEKFIFIFLSMICKPRSTSDSGCIDIYTYQIRLRLELKLILS